MAVTAAGGTPHSHGVGTAFTPDKMTQQQANFLIALSIGTVGLNSLSKKQLDWVNALIKHWDPGADVSTPGSLAWNQALGMSVVDMGMQPQAQAAQQKADQFMSSVAAGGDKAWQKLTDAQKHQVISYVNMQTAGANFGINSKPADILTALGTVKGVSAAGAPPGKPPGTSTALTKDSYLNWASAAGYKITPHLQDLAKQAEQNKLAHWQWTQELNRTGQFQQRADAFYGQQLQEWGIPMDANLKQLMQEAQVKHYDQATFDYYLRQTPEYHQAFPGIMDKNGTLKMSETTYLSWKQSFQDSAQKAGVKLNDKMLGQLFKNNTTPSAFDQKATAVGRLQQNPELFHQFARELQAEGLAPKGGVSQSDMLSFVIGEGPKTWTDLWQNSVTSYQATQAGIKIAKGTGLYDALSRQKVEGISDKGFTEAEMQSRFGTLAQDLLTNLPLSKIQGYGLTKGDIVQANFGGKKQAEVIQLMQHIKDTESAFYQNQRAGSTLTPSGALGKPTTYGGPAERAQA